MSKVNFQALGREEKISITDHFLITPCVRCDDSSHSCLECSNTTSSNNQSGPYGSLKPGKKLGADKWIEALKTKYAEGPLNLIFHNAIVIKEEQDRQKAFDGQRRTKHESKQTIAKAIVGFTTSGSDAEASVPQVSDTDSGPEENCTFSYDRAEVPARRTPGANDLQRMPAAPNRPDFDNGLAKLEHRKLEYPARTEYAEYPTSEKLVTNHFQLFRKKRDALKLYEYKIPELEGKGKRKARAIMETIIKCQVLSRNASDFATDYFTTIVAWTDLEPVMRDGGHALISRQNEPAKYHILKTPDGPFSLQYVRTVDMRDLFDYVNMKPDLGVDTNIKPMVNLLNIIISKCVEQSSVGTVPGGANKFYRKDAHCSLGNSVSLCTHRGYSYTVKAGAGAVLLNMNSLTSAFWCPITFDRVMRDNAAFGNVDWNTFEGLVTGLRVYITYDRGDEKTDPEAYKRLNSEENRIKPIVGLGNLAKMQEFTPEGGKKTTVAAYFEARYGKGFLKDTDLMVVNLGKKNDPRWYPAEKLQVLAYQKYKGLVPNDLTHRMIRTACQKPPVVKALIGVEGLETLGVPHNHNGSVALPACSLFTIGPALLRIDGGRLPYPTIAYDEKSTTIPKRGRWKFQDRQFYRHDVNNTFNTLVFREHSVHQNSANQIFDNLVQWAGTPQPGRSGYSVATVVHAGDLVLNDVDRQIMLKTIEGGLKEGPDARPNMAMLILRGKNIPGYSTFKDLCDRKYGLHSICITQNCGAGDNGDKWGNISLKMNLKAAGSNHTIAGGLISHNFMKDTLVLGADVTHPGPGSIPGCPSIAAIVGSVDAHAGRFLGSMRLQSESRKEIIDEVEPMIRERVRDWIAEMTTNGSRYVSLPKKIIYYRDGISEGQYDDVRKYEVATFGRAFVDVVNGLNIEGRVDPEVVAYMPEVIAIVCGKRHHVRFYPVDTTSADVFENCHPGTAVDDVVTSPYYQDFYLQSHAAIKGTAKPAHYFVVENEPNETVDNLRKFTHELCYTYVRAPVGVSYASPAYYADRLCERGRCYLRDYFVAPNQSTVRHDYDEFKSKLEKNIKAAREMEFPPTKKAQQNCMTSQPKNPMLAARQEADKKELQKACDRYIMQEAKTEFEKYRKGGNPWHPNVSKTMFWM